MEAETETTYPLDLNLLKLFVYAMNVDGEIAPSEVDKLRSFTKAIGWDQDVVTQAIEDELVQPSDFVALLDAITDEHTQESAITVCASIVAADGKFEEEERWLMIDMCEAWGFEPDSLVAGIEEALGIKKEQD